MNPVREGGENMTISKTKKHENPEDVELLKSDVAFFASSIGLSSAVSSSLPKFDFDDSDFRKTGPLKPKETEKTPKNKPTHGDNKKKETKVAEEKKGKNGEREKTRHPPLSLDHYKPFDRWKHLPKLPLMKASSLGVWHVDADELEAKVIGNERKRIEVKNAEELKNLVAKKKELGERLLAQYTQDFETSRGQSGDIKMLMATQRSGTAIDKVSAFSVLVGENPIANMRSLDALLAMVTSRVGKRHAFSGFEALKELFLSSLLPDRKLKNLLQHPLNHLPESKDGYSLLLFWYWEECLKQRYERFIFALEEASRDTLPPLKNRALKIMYSLLRSKSEQERRLLSALVNKLGDPENKGASGADFHLSNLLSEHPNMKVNFLSQIRLSNKGDGPKVAKRLVDVYFALFKVLIAEAGGGKKIDSITKRDGKNGTDSPKNGKGQSAMESNVGMDSRLLSGLLTGVNRAFPYVASDEVDDVIQVQTPMLFKLVHSKNFNVGVQALMLLDKISSKNQIVSDRFYRALYSKLLLPAAMNSSKAEMFIGLLLRAMKNDINLKRVSAFSKRLLQVALHQPPQCACGCLFLLSEVLKARPPLWNVVLQNESIDEDLEHFEDIIEEPEHKQGLGPNMQQEKAVDDVMNSRDVGKSGSNSSSDSEDEDTPASYSEEDGGSDGGEDLLMGEGMNVVENFKTVSNCDRGHPQNPSTGEDSRASSLPGGYNPLYREPSYCNADHVCWWELMVLGSHVHPSVATMARTLLSGANIVYNGNPLNDLSLIAFLDKFMEKKPKSSAWHGGSQIEPARKLEMNNHLIGAELLSLAEVDVPPEDLVFHKFYMNKMSSSKKLKKKKKKKGADDEAAEELFDVDGGDESDNEEIENLLDSEEVPLESEGDYDYDDLDQVANEDDDDLIANESDVETDLPSDLGEGQEEEDGHLSTGGANNDTTISKQIKRKRKSGTRAGVSPFASLEDYEYLMNNDSSTREKSRSRKKRRQ
ncbi:PREDICTED: CCAAT/enhancer-binding protein zeta isoform X2 [Nelumbo nucifera]|uniref:CCAAT/enhancer-binding protein zeta isoform X2 n=1 Tax=Nelumbo nucifera TaxID=4432 RepID=A0A1U8A5J6_NELNU|nr:PREDICTED: CCAAT/enhancer-binding protein zeta isoform X2 [Nelumbo nucifera]